MSLQDALATSLTTNCSISEKLFVTYKQEEPKPEGKRRIVDLRFGNVKVNAQSLKRTYQE